MKAWSLVLIYFLLGIWFGSAGIRFLLTRNYNAIFPRTSSLQFWCLRYGSWMTGPLPYASMHGHLNHSQKLIEMFCWFNLSTLTCINWYFALYGVGRCDSNLSSLTPSWACAIRRAAYFLKSSATENIRAGSDPGWPWIVNLQVGQTMGGGFVQTGRFWIVSGCQTSV